MAGLEGLRAATRDFGNPERLFTETELREEEKRLYPDSPSVLPPKRDPIRTSGYSLIPPEPMGEVARVFQIGAEKYEPRGWEKGLLYSDVVDRIFKHLGRWTRGEKYDLEDGQHNLASVAWAALVLMELENTHPECDDVHSVKQIIGSTKAPESTWTKQGLPGEMFYDTGSA